MAMAAAQPPAPPSPRTPPRAASPGSSIEEDDDLYVSPKASPPRTSDVPPPASTTSAMSTLTNTTLSHDPAFTDYNTWSAAMASQPNDPHAAQERKASDNSNASSKRSLPKPPRPPSTTESMSTVQRKNSIQPTLSQRYQQLKERSAASAARRASQSSDGHTYATSWERRGSERSDDFHSVAAGMSYGRLPALEDVQQQQQQQQRNFVASPEPVHPPSAFLDRQGSYPPPSLAQPHGLPDQAPPSAFPGRDKQGSLPPIPLSSPPSEVSPLHSPTRRDSLPPIPSESPQSPQSPQRRPSQALPPIPAHGTAPTSPASPPRRRPSVPQTNGAEKANGALRDFIPYASVYGGVDGEDEHAPGGSVSRRDTLPPLPSPPREQAPKEQSQAQLYAQQQVAQQRQHAEERRRQGESRQQHPPQQRQPQQQPLRSPGYPGYESDKDQPPLPSAHRAPPSGPGTPAPPSAFTAPQPPAPQPGQSQSLPVRRQTTLGHAADSYASQQQPQPALQHSQSTVRPQRSHTQSAVGAPDRSPANATPQPSTPQRTRPLHPEFTHGDLTIQVSSPQAMDFLVSYTVLTTASELIASTLAQFPANKAPRVAISESVPEARLLLSALHFGNINHSSMAVADRDPLSVAEYLTLLRLYRKYQVSAFFTDLLQYQINARAVELSQGVMRRDRLQTLDVVRLAVESRSARLWDMLNKYSGHWFESLAPARLTREDKDRLGTMGLEVLVAWNALRLGCGDRPDGVKVGYDAGRICMWRVRDEKRKFYPCAA